MRAMRVSLSPLPSLVFKYAYTPRQHCAVGPVTSTSSQSSRKRKVLWNFTRLSSVVENIQRRTKTYASKSTLSRIRKDEVEPFVPWHWPSMKRSLFAGDVSAPWRTEDKLCYLFCLFVFIKLLKEKHEKGSERFWFRGVVGRAPSAVIDAGAACSLPTGSAASKSALLAFFWTLVLLGRWKTLFVTGDVRQNWELQVRRSLLRSCAPIRFFQGCTHAAWASTASPAAPASM